MCLISSGKPRDIKDYVEELLKFLGKWELHEKLKNWQVPKFPIDGNTLKAHNCPSGKIMGVVLGKLRDIWALNKFDISVDELVKHLPKIYEELNIVDGKQVKKART